MYFRILHEERSGAVSCLLADLVASQAVLMTRTFALPKLRKVSFPMALVREPAQVATAHQPSELRALPGLPGKPRKP
jgi:hypothetical protein